MDTNAKQIIDDSRRCELKPFIPIHEMLLVVVSLDLSQGCTYMLTAVQKSSGQALAAVGGGHSHVTAVEAPGLGGGEGCRQQLHTNMHQSHHPMSHAANMHESC